MDISFVSARYAWLFTIILPCIAALQIWVWRRNRRAVDEFMPPAQRIHERIRRTAQKVLLAVCDAALAALLILGLMHPERKITVYVPIYEHAATVIAVDISPSIGAEAGYFGEGGRLGAVKQAFLDLLSTEKNLAASLWDWLTGKPAAQGRIMEGQRIGIVGFAGAAFVKMPPITRQSTLQNAFKQLSPNIPIIAGTNFAAAVEESAQLFTDEDKVRTIILLTDGEEEEGKSVPIATALEAAVKAKVKVFSIVVGHERALVPGTDDVWTEPAFEKDERGNVIGVQRGSVPDALAERTGGQALLFKDRGKLYGMLEKIFEGVTEAAKEPREERQNLQPWVAAAWLLLVAVRIIVQYAMEGERPSVAQPA